MPDAPFVYELVNTETGENLSVEDSEEVANMLAFGPWTLTEGCRARMKRRIAELDGYCGREGRWWEAK